MEENGGVRTVSVHVRELSCENRIACMEENGGVRTVSVHVRELRCENCVGTCQGIV